MRLLLDTHALIWWLEGGARLCEQARAAIRSRANEVRVSPVTADRSFATYDVPIMPA